MCACTGHWKRVWACGMRGEAAGASVCNVGVVGSVCVCVGGRMHVLGEGPLLIFVAENCV